jgi:ABC-2 type transport system permease protein
MNVSTRKWLEIVRFELVHQLRRRSTWIFFGVFLLMLFGETNGQVLEALESEIPFHAPLFIAESSVGMALIGLLVMAAMTGDAATRDVETRIEPLMNAAPVGRAAYLGGRFAGAFLLSALLLLTVPLALILAPFVHPGLGPELVGPFRLAAFLQSYFLLILPNAFVAVALMFTLATLVRHTLGSYAGAAVMLMGSILTTQLVGRTMGRWDLAALINPAGHTSIAVMARTWPPADLNARLVGLGGGLLWNRLLWLGVACALLALTYNRFRYGANSGTARWWQRGAWRTRAHAEVPSVSAGRAPLAVPVVRPTFGAAGRARQVLAVTRDSIREMTTRWSWLVLPYLAFHVLVAEGELGVRGTPVFPTTGRVLAAFFELPPPFIISIFVFAVLAAGELVWRERDANIDALSDAAPLPVAMRFAGKLLGLWLVIVALHALLMLADMALQVRLGWYDFDIPLYFKVLFGLQLLGPLVFALVALSVHVVVNHKHVGHLVVLASFAVANVTAQTLGIEHPLLFPFAIPGWRYSPISGFDPYVAPFLWFMLYWTLWALLLAIIAGAFWVRGLKPSIRGRMGLARWRLRGGTARAAAVVLGLLVIVGAFLFYNTNILNDYRSSAEGARRQAEYERRYGRHEGTPQPQLSATKLDIELDPDRRAAEIRGVYTLVNRAARPIDTIHVAVSSAVRTGAIDFGRPVRAALRDDDLGHRTYVLARPLQPGHSLRMSWQVRYERRGFTARVPRGVSNAVVGNGTFIQMGQWIPLIGYQPDRELASAADRKKHGLAPRPVDARSLDNLEARRDPTGRELFDLDVTIGTAANQTAIAPGELRRTWTRGRRRYFHYATDAPVGHGYAIFSAGYAVRRARWGTVAIEVFHHPPHTRNLQRMLRSIELSLAQYTKRFGPYPYKVLRLVEYTRKDGGAHAAHGHIWFSEVFPLLDPARDERRFDLPFAVVAHETAHQFQVAPARVEGIVLLSESFAWYAAMGVIEEEYGAAHLARFLDFMRRDYLEPRSRADVPLLRASDRFLGYRKGPFAMYALREYMGQGVLDLAWRRLIAKHRSHEPPYATSLDLYRELQEVTPLPLRTLLGDLLERNTFWELKTTRATARAMPNGRWQLNLEVAARKVVVDTEGVETNVPMNDLIEIGAFAPDGKRLHLAMHRIRTGAQTITITVPQRPARAGIDPRHLLIDVETKDNVRELSEPKRGGGPPQS